MDYINVKVVPMPNVNLGPDTVICQGQTYTLDGGPGAQYFWLPGNETTQTLNVTATGTYVVEVDGGQNTRCKDYDTVFVKVLQVPVVDLGPDLCVEDTVTLNAGNPGFEYSWSTGASSQTIVVSHSGTYTVTVAEELGHNCDVTDDIYVKVVPVPELTIGPDSTVCQHQAIEIKARDKDPNFVLTDYDYTYAWMLDGVPYGQADPFIVLSWLSAGPHTIIGYAAGCDIYADTLILTVQLCELTIPNIITPNGDGQNDRFRIPNLEYYPNSELFIYNRWGRKVYESSNYQNDWDGTGHSDGVYFFLLRVNYGNAGNGEQWKEFHGTLTILR
jgi:gliding motility-associated-like protein